MNKGTLKILLSCISLALSYVAGGLMLGFTVHKLMQETYAATVLLVVGGVLLAATAIYKNVALVFEVRGNNRLTTFICVPESAAFIVAMIGGIMTKGQYAMTAEIVFCAFALAEDSALTAINVGGLSAKKAAIVCIGLAAISVVFVFVPVFVGRMTVLAALRDYAAYAVALISTALLVSRGLIKKGDRHE